MQVRPTSAVPKLARFLMSAARTWVCPTTLAVTTMPLVLTVATEVLEDVQTYMPLPPDGYREQQNTKSAQECKSVIVRVKCLTLAQHNDLSQDLNLEWLD